jgi:hypothetical protein
MSVSLPIDGGENNTDDARTDEPNTSDIQRPIELVGASNSADPNDNDSSDDYIQKKTKLDHPSLTDGNQIPQGSSTSETTIIANSSISDTNNESSKTEVEAKNSSTSTSESQSSDKINSSTDAKSTPIQSQQKPKPKTDIYGRIPTKEPKYPISCPTCGRIISVSRFAAHLEKCLGISGRSVSPTKR